MDLLDCNHRAHYIVGGQADIFQLVIARNEKMDYFILRIFSAPMSVL